MINWEKWDDGKLSEIHGDVYFHRDLYEGKHAEIFPRAVDLIQKGEITARIEYGTQQALNVQTPYIIANVAKLIPEIPAMLVGRSIGKVKSSLPLNERTGTAVAEVIDGPEGDAVNNTVDDPQQEVLEQIEKNSRLSFSHWTNIVQQQIDGGLVGVPVYDDRGLRIEFKQRDVYFPHDDGKGVDLKYDRTFDEEDYIHIYRERSEDGNLTCTHMLYKGKTMPRDLVDEQTTKELLGLDNLVTVFEGRSRSFIEYWPNEATFRHPLGTSCLKNQAGKQDEINWTLTRSALTFERNGKPRIAVTPEIFQALSEAATQRYGDASRIDHRDLEITTFNEQGKAMEIIQIDITKIGDLQWVKDLMKLMFIETKTSEKAVDFYMEQTTAAQSGVAKFYDLFLSIVKAEQIQAEYVYFLQQLFENCLWLLAQDPDSKIEIEEPLIELRSMIPISKSELLTENATALEKGVQSLETSVRRSNPHASEEFIQEELKRLEEADALDPAYPTTGDEE